MIFAICISVLLLLFLAIMLITHQLIKLQFGRGSYQKPPTSALFYRDYEDRYERKPVSFFSGKNRLQGYLYGEGNRKGVLVFAHGIGAGHENYIGEILWMVDHGWQVFAYDATGCCESEGKGSVGLVQSMLDLDAALTHIETDPAFAGLPIAVMGHSWGGYAAAAVLNLDHNITAAVSISGYAKPVAMMMRYAQKYMGSAMVLMYPFVWLDTLFTFGKNTFRTAVKGINHGDTPVLLVHGSEDELIPIPKLSVIGQVDKITNPNVKTLVIDGKGQTGHGTVFRNAESLPYIDRVNAEHQILCEKYGGNVPDDELAKWVDSLDKKTINRPNDALLNEILRFLTDARERKTD